jgi:Uma2 family endonuclease
MDQTMSMPSLLPHVWTADEVLAIPESPGYRFEAVDGELIVSPSPSLRHQRAVAELLALIHQYVAAQGIGQAITAPFDVVADTLTVVQPDVLVLPLVSGRAPRSWRDAGRLLLAVEVLSPSSIRADRYLKRRKYQQMGALAWIVDLDERLVEIWTPDAQDADVAATTLSWHPDGPTSALTIDLLYLFAKADGDVL